MYLTNLTYIVFRNTCEQLYTELRPVQTVSCFIIRLLLGFHFIRDSYSSDNLVLGTLAPVLPQRSSTRPLPLSQETAQSTIVKLVQVAGSRSQLSLRFLVRFTCSIIGVA